MKVKTFLMIFVALATFLASSRKSVINSLGGKETTALYPIRQNSYKEFFLTRMSRV